MGSTVSKHECPSSLIAGDGTEILKRDIDFLNSLIKADFINPITQISVSVETLTDAELTKYQTLHLKHYPETTSHYKKFFFIRDQQHQDTVANKSLFYKWRGVLPKQRYTKQSFWETDYMTRI